MKTTACAPRILPAALAVALSGCVYAPPMPPQSYTFDRHPGVSLDVSWYYNWDGSGYAISTLANRSNVDKCAWTQVLDSRLLRAGESWQVSMGQTPANVGISNVVPQDPNCLAAKQAR